MKRPCSTYSCHPDPALHFPGGVRPPALYAYPSQPASTKILFVGWNPPKAFGGFWSMEYDDALRKELHWILRDLRMVESEKPEEAFLAEFVARGYYFVHTIKCWTAAKLPGFGRDKRNRKARSDLSEPLLVACADQHLFREIEALKPAALCVLGEAPFFVFRKHYGLKTKATPTQGISFELGGSGSVPARLLYTCLPLPQKLRDPARDASRWAREIIRDHLARFVAAA